MFVVCLFYTGGTCHAGKNLQAVMTLKKTLISNITEYSIAHVRQD